MTIGEPSFYAHAVELASKLTSDDADVYSAALMELRDALEARASISRIQQNATENYAAAEERTHEAEEESWRLRRELAKDDEEMFKLCSERAVLGRTD